MRLRLGACALAVFFSALVPGLLARERRSSSGEVTRDDLLISLHTSHSRLSLIRSSRAWRRGVRTIITSDEKLTPQNTPPGLLDTTWKFRETWRQFNNIKDSGLPIGYHPGDLRAAIAPFIANLTVGIDKYKWILYGDDDTVFNVDNVLALVNTMDHSLPYFISDCIWYPNNSTGDIKLHPNREAPRCLPCNYKDPLLDSPDKCLSAYPKTPRGVQFNATPACPCTPQALCASDNWDIFDQSTCNFKVNPAKPNFPGVGWWYMIHGGAGALISVGLMRHMSYTAVEDYLVNAPMQSGDALISKVMWYVGNIAPTDPGYGFCRPHIQMFDPGWRGYRARGIEDLMTGDRGADPTSLISRLELALDNKCDEICEDQLSHIISLHVRSKYAAADWLGGEVNAQHPDDVQPKFRAATYIIRKLGMLFEKYAAKRRNDASWRSKSVA